MRLVTSRYSVGVCALVALLSAGLLAGRADASSLAVTKVADTADGVCDADCSLREAIVKANESPDADVITLPAGVYALSLSGVGEDDAASGDLDVLGSLQVLGAGARTTSVVGDGSDRVFEVRASGSDVTLSGFTVTGGRGVDQGAGIMADAAKTFALRDAAVLGNATSAPASVTGRQGAGLFLGATASTVERVLVAGNTATSIAGDSFAPQGAGIFFNGPATLTNVTIADNVADGRLGGSFGPQGAGIFFNDFVTMTNVTIAGNNALDTVAAQVQGPGIFYNNATAMKQVIVAGNTTNGTATVGQCFLNDTITSAATNISPTAAACGFTQPGDQNADPLLDPLADNGGPTNTIAPATGSPALDRVPFAACPADDQRGIPRAGLGTACDLGALEVGTPAPPTPTPTPPASSPTPAPTPKPRPISAAKAFTLPSAKKCLSRRAFTIRIRKLPQVTFVSAIVKVNGKRVKTIKRNRITAPVNLKGLPKGRFKVSITAAASDGRTVTGTRTYRTCTTKRRSPGPKL